MHGDLPSLSGTSVARLAGHHLPLQTFATCLTVHKDFWHPILSWQERIPLPTCCFSPSVVSSLCFFFDLYFIQVQGFCSVLFSCQSPELKSYLVYPYFRLGNWGSEQGCDLFNITQDPGDLVSHLCFLSKLSTFNKMSLYFDFSIYYQWETYTWEKAKINL